MLKIFDFIIKVNQINVNIRFCFLFSIIYYKYVLYFFDLYIMNYFDILMFMFIENLKKVFFYCMKYLKLNLVFVVVVIVIGVNFLYLSLWVLI